MTRFLVAIGMMLASATAALAADKIVKESLTSNGTARTYYLFVPDSAADKPAPLIILLHGSGHDGKLLVEHWQTLAKKEGIILAGPDATVRQGWSTRADGPLFLRHVLEAVKATHPIDPKRVYLFGHSAGAVHGLGMGILESEYFAAVAVHAGVVPPEIMPFAERAPRKIPLAIWVGTNDAFFPLGQVRATRDALQRQGFDADLTEIKGHTHDYYGRSPQINSEVWAFLKDKHLDRDPQYQDYTIAR